MKKATFFLLLTVCIAQFAFAQPPAQTTLEETKNIAQEQLEKTDYYNAEAWATKILKKDKKSIEGALVLAQALYGQRDYRQAEIKFKVLLAKDRRTQQYQDYRFYYAQCLKKNGKYDEAEAQFEQFMENASDENFIKLAETEIAGIKWARQQEVNPDVLINNLGTGVNSPYSELSPVPVSATEIYYSGLSASDLIEIDPENQDKNQQIYNRLYKASSSDGKWSKGQELPVEINRDGIHNAHVALSADGNSLYFSRCLLEGSTTSNCDIYVSTKENGQWSEAVILEGGVNADNFVSKQPAVGSINGREAVFFASNMDGGQGGFDIYYAVKQNGARFGAPVNLGGVVNTIGDDVTPFFAKDKLYFSSTGHPGMGGLDVFSAKQEGVQFTGVENLGASVNSTVDDWYYSVDETGFNAFMVSNRKVRGAQSFKSATCCYDIYSVTYPIPVIIDIIASTVDQSTGKPLNGVTVELIDITSSNKDAKTNERGNNFTWNDVNKPTKYRLIAKKDGFADAVKEISTEGIEASKQLTETLELKPIVVALNVKTFNKATGRPLQGVTVDLIEVPSNDTDSKTNASSNEFSWGKVKRETSYKLVAKKDGYESASTTVSTADLGGSKSLSAELRLDPFTDPNESIALPEILFKYAKSEFIETSFSQLDRLVKLMTDFPDIELVDISAHTDARGTKEYNRKLSQRRADATIKYLSERGISPSRLQASGKGEEEIRNRCVDGVDCSDEEHLYNRRVEFKILKGRKTVPQSYLLGEKKN